MPTNLYGPNDNYDYFSSHVLPAFIRRFHEAKESRADVVECWGDGSPRREFLHVDDLAEACVLLMESYSDSQIINVGSSNWTSRSRNWPPWWPRSSATEARFAGT
jgi:GDP-L-fucose synthase